MFGPNQKAIFNATWPSTFHHRSDAFHTLIENLDEIFHQRFDLDEYELLFVTGSGTFVNEVVIASFKYKMETLYANADFGKRLQATNESWSTWRDKATLSNKWKTRFACMTVYETSKARKNPTTIEADFMFHDMVSAFPYYMPDNPDVWTTVSSKQLGAYPVLGIIGIRKLTPLDKYFRILPGSLLCLQRHYSYRKQKSETIATPTIPLYEDLLNSLKTFDRKVMIKKIDQRGKQLDEALKGYIYGEGPVRNLVKCDITYKIYREFNLYRNADDEPQVFLYAGSDEDFEHLIHYCEDLI